MLGDVPVVDAVVHCFNFGQSNLIDLPAGRVHQQAYLTRAPQQPEYADYIIDQDRYEQRHTAETMVSVCFAESATDIAVYHSVRRCGTLDSGEWSPWDAGLEFRERAGRERVSLVAGLTDPFDTARSLDELDEFVDAHGVRGLRLHPWAWDATQARAREFLYDDERLAFPLVDHLKNRGLNSVVLQRTIDPIVRGFGGGNLDRIVDAFPGVNFEIAHDGWSYMDDLAVLRRRPNVYATLEGISALLGCAPRRFAEILGALLQCGDGDLGTDDRILWATGAIAVHPQPLVELFWAFQMPDDLIEGSGYPQLTDELKRKILGANYARKNDVNLAAAIGAIRVDAAREAQNAGDYAKPWSTVLHAEPCVRTTNAGEQIDG